MAAEINTSSPLMTFFSFLTTGTCILFGHLVASYQNIHLPPIIIEILQSLSYGGAATVAFLTVYKFIKEKKSSKKSTKK